MNNFQRWKGIMKCVPFEEKRLLKWHPPYIVQPKFDGDRCRNEPLQDSSILLTSEENIFYSVPHINIQLINTGYYSLPLDGELYNHDLHAEGDHDLIHSICSRTVNLHERYEEMEFWIFDIKVRGKSQVERLKMLKDIKEVGNIRIAPYWICDSLDEVKRVYDKLISMKYEGIVVRNLYNTYEDKRSTLLMKFKPKAQDTYKIIGYKEEISINGIPKGRLGSILLSSQNGDTFSVSAGLNDDEKFHFWNIREEIIGKDAIVHYQHLTSNKIPKGCFDLEILI